MCNSKPIEEDKKQYISDRSIHFLVCKMEQKVGIYCFKCMWAYFDKQTNKQTKQDEPQF